MHPPFHRISLTVNTMLLVAMLGSISVISTLYGAWHLQQQEQRYHALLAQQAQAAQHMGMLRHNLGMLRQTTNSSVRASTHSELDSNPFYGHQLQAEVQHTYRLLAADLQYLTPLLPDATPSLEQLDAELTTIYQHSLRIAQALEDGLYHTASAVHRYEFTPAIEPSIARINQLHHDAKTIYQRQAEDVARRTQHNMLLSMLLTLLATVLTTALTGALVLRYISRPIARLTHVVQSLTLQRWSPDIPAQKRRDEIGDLARSLLQLSQSLQHAANTQQPHHDTPHHNHLLTEQLLELTSALPGPVFQALWSHSHPQRMNFISRQWRQMLGLPAHHPDALSAALTALETYCPELRSEFNRQLHQAAQTLQQVDFTTTYRRCDGSQHWCKVLATPSLRPDGSVLFNGVWFDTSRETEQAHALQTAKQQAEDSAQARALLQASISHEIRTPLNAILGLTQLALKQPDARETRGHLDSIFRAGMHLRGIINEVLEFSKIDAGQLHLESTDFRLSNVLDDVLMMCMGSAKHKGLQLSYHVAPQVPDCLRGDPHRIAQILLNYVNNAIKFTPVGSVRIDIGLAPHSSLHRIVLHASVTDTGLGIPADRLPYLFDPFQQADSSITRRFGGTGLGLAIARELAQLMNGQTGVQSQPNHGSTFWFTAMLEPARTPVPRTAAHPPPATDMRAPAYLQGLRVLVVDDNPLNRTVTQAMLQAGGIQVDTAENGHEALNALLRHAAGHYAAVLMDLQMPVLDGLSATRQLRQYPHLRELPVIAMTAHTSLNDVQKALQAGMNAHLGKPVLESAMWQALQQSVPPRDTAAQPVEAHTAADEAAASTTSALPAPVTASEPSAEPTPPALAPTHDGTLLLTPTAEQGPNSASLFDSAAIDELVRLLPPDKLHPLVEQFVQDTQQRMTHLHMAMLEGDTAALRAETHKIRGTAATFGQMRLSALAQRFTQALHAGNTPLAHQLLADMHTSCTEGIALLLHHLQLPAPTPST